MISEDRRALQAGGVVLTLLAAGVVSVIALDDVDLRSTVRFQVHVANLNGLTETADLQIAGKIVGRVDAIRLISIESVRPEHPLFGLGGATLDVAIDSDYAGWAPRNGEYFISSKGLLGEKFLEVGPPRDDVEWEGTVEDGDQIRGIDPPRMDRTLARTFDNLNISRDFMDAVGPDAKILAEELRNLNKQLEEVQPRQGLWDEAMERIGETIDVSAPLRAKIAAAKLERLASTMERGRRVMSRADLALAPLPPELAKLSGDLRRIQHGIPPNLADTMAVVLTRVEFTQKTVQHSLALARAMSMSVQRGEGTVGGLANDPEFSDDAKKLGKIMKRQPWKIFGHPGNRATPYRPVPNPDKKPDIDFR